MKKILTLLLGLLFLLLLVLGVGTEVPSEQETSAASIETAVQAVAHKPAVLDTGPSKQSAAETTAIETTDTGNTRVAPKPTDAPGETSPLVPIASPRATGERGRVVSVVDGDTLKVAFGPRIETIRVIGIDTPETVHPSKPVECFGREASAYAKELLSGTEVTVETDPTQGERDKYDRRLGYITLADGRDFGDVMLREGYAYEYTYDEVYTHQTEYQAAELAAEAMGKGLWATGVCDSYTRATTLATPPLVGQSCDIKGNISRSGEKIFHVPGQSYYSKTIVTESAGERYFCTEAEAVAAGWRKALQ